MLMDYLKTRATLWKKVATASGEAWVDQKTEDLAAATRWKSS
jgi:molybdopterin synthase catalytic subunit